MWARLPVPARRAVVAARRLAHGGHRAHPRVDVDVTGGLAVLTVDDGKVNAISPRLCELFVAGLDRVAADDGVRGLVIAGRPGQFSAGFDLDTLMVGGRGRDELVRRGWDLMLRMLTLPVPVVVACTGNAVAAGAALLLTGDARLGAGGEFRIGFNEMAIGLPLPGVVLMLARDRLAGEAFDDATRGARLYPPSEAVAAGYLDRVVPPDELLDAAVAQAHELAAMATFAGAKRDRVGPLAERMRAQLPDDLSLIAQIGG